MRAFLASVPFHLFVLAADAQAQTTVQLKNAKWAASISVEWALVDSAGKCTATPATKETIAPGALSTVMIVVQPGQQLCYRRDYDPADATPDDWTCWRTIDFAKLSPGELPLR